MLRGQPNNLRSAQRVYRSGGPNLVTQSHSDRPVPLLFHSAKVLAVFPVAFSLVFVMPAVGASASGAALGCRRGRADDARAEIRADNAGGLSKTRPTSR
jgi:hypothetical protein